MANNGKLTVVEFVGLVEKAGGMEKFLAKMAKKGKKQFFLGFMEKHNILMLKDHPEMEVSSVTQCDSYNSFNNTGKRIPPRSIHGDWTKGVV